MLVPVRNTPAFQCRVHGFDPESGENIAMGQLSPQLPSEGLCATVRKAHTLPMLSLRHSEPVIPQLERAHAAI